MCALPLPALPLWCCLLLALSYYLKKKKRRLILSLIPNLPNAMARTHCVSHVNIVSISPKGLRKSLTVQRASLLPCSNFTLFNPKSHLLDSTFLLHF